jgi:hypothetical protein
MTHNVRIEAAPEVIAKAGGEYRIKRYILVVLMFLVGLWFAYDGFVNWPRERELYDAAPESNRPLMKKPHTEMDILIQRDLAYLLVPLAPLLLVFFLYNSRGELRLSGDMLFVPGHPPVPLNRILSLDKTQWARKGIAFAHYQLEDSIKGRIRLDDFVYQSEPVHIMVDQIDADMNPPPATAGIPKSESPKSE